MSEKKPEKFTMTTSDGTTHELELPPSNVDLNHPLLNDLQLQLLRLRPGEQFKLPNGHFDAVSKDPLELTIIAEIGVHNGCAIKMNTQISEDPPIFGYIFTRTDDVPLLDWIEPVGGTQ
jgi:hypothetical protein